MSWVDKAHRENKLHKEIDRALSSPKYQKEEKRKLDEEYRKALDCFLLISADYLYRQGYRKKRLLRFIEFAVYQMHCVETDPDYFRLLNDAMAEETGIDILQNLVNEREKVQNKRKDDDK